MIPVLYVFQKIVPRRRRHPKGQGIRTPGTPWPLAAYDIEDGARCAMAGYATFTYWGRP